MNSTNRNIPNYKSNSRGGAKRGGRGGYNGSNYKSDTKVETVSTPNKPNTSPQFDMKDPEGFANPKISLNNPPTSIPSQKVSSPQAKQPSFKSKKVKIDFDSLPDLNSSSQKNLDASVNESKGDINPDTSLISEDNRAANNEDDKGLVSVENFDANNNNTNDTNDKKDATNSRKQSSNVEVNVLNNATNAEKTIDVSMNDEINLNRTNNEESSKETDVADSETKNEEERASLENKINEVKIDVNVTVETVAKESKGEEGKRSN